MNNVNRGQLNICSAALYFFALSNSTTLSGSTSARPIRLPSVPSVGTDPGKASAFPGKALFVGNPCLLPLNAPVVPEPNFQSPFSSPAFPLSNLIAFHLCQRPRQIIQLLAVVLQYGEQMLHQLLILFGKSRFPERLQLEFEPIF